MKCPGQDSRYWKPDAIFEANCPKCGRAVEFFKDDTTRRCKACGHRFLNPGLDFGCASYCKYAEQCIGNLPPELITQKEDLLKDRVAIEVKRYLQRDFKAIGLATRRARYAEKIGRQEGGNLAVILTASYLMGVGGGKDPAMAREILLKLGAAEPLIKEVCRIIDHQKGLKNTHSTESRCVQDAAAIALLEDRNKVEPMDPPSLTEWIRNELLTENGRKLAEDILLPEKQH